MKITENNFENEVNVNPKYLTIDEIINLLLKVRVDLTSIRESIPNNEVTHQLERVINGIDIVGCELTQNIAKKFKKK
ncbi:MAG: hypothetical protein EU530_07450 [Promethearchaeota archaeon]|nr:MAG: hypothetical protein EU530_07450 [Candidatus Lokiarchaeota archaeon]